MSVAKKGLSFKVADFICLFDFEWHGQNKVGIIGILELWGNLWTLGQCIILSSEKSTMGSGCRCSLNNLSYYIFKPVFFYSGFKWF